MEKWIKTKKWAESHETKQRWFQINSHCVINVNVNSKFEVTDDSLWLMASWHIHMIVSPAGWNFFIFKIFEKRAIK